jgi:D-xylose reductase
LPSPKCIRAQVVADLIYDAIQIGVRHFDCACDYGNEIEVGVGIKRALENGLCTREELWVIFLVVLIHS